MFSNAQIRRSRKSKNARDNDEESCGVTPTFRNLSNTQSLKIIRASRDKTANYSLLATAINFKSHLLDRRLRKLLLILKWTWTISIRLKMMILSIIYPTKVSRPCIIA